MKRKLLLTASLLAAALGLAGCTGSEDTVGDVSLGIFTFKDIKLKPEELARRGTMAYPLDIMEPKIPGLGDVDWADFVSQLTMVGYEGDACIEVEDASFEGSRERLVKSIELSKRYLEQFVI